MLQFLKINNFLLFKNQEISFDGNFTVITGETGSGKSMLIKALRFVLGEKQDLPLMDFSVTAEFRLESGSKALRAILLENDIEAEDNIVMLRRNLSADNKGKAFINDMPVTLKLLKTISDELVEFHSQHKQLTSFSQANSLNLIDQFLSDNYLLKEVEALATKINAINSKIEILKLDKKELELDKDYIEHSLKELRLLKLKEGEELELLDKKKLFTDRIRIVSALEGLLEIFARDNGVINKLIRSQRNIAKLESEIGLDDCIESAIFHLNELQNQTESKLKDFNSHENIEFIEERLSKIRELSRKYRCTSDELVNITDDLEGKLNKLDNIDRSIVSKNSEKEKLQQEYLQIAESLSAKRVETAKLLENKILQELAQIKLDKVELNIKISPNQQNLISIKGLDNAKFLIRTNKGFDFAEIDKIASGGELSRIMLAFKVALAENNQKTTIIFDEIDSGTGGAVAQTIGNRMKSLAESNQIIAISHQPQVAAKADQHLLVEKSVGLISETKINNLSKEEKTKEIARMLAGVNISDSAVLAAISLIEG